TRTGTLSITDNASGSSHTMSRPHTRNTPACGRLSPSTHIFGSQTVGTTSTAQAVALTNTGGTALSPSSLTANGDFAQTNNCGSRAEARRVGEDNGTLWPAAAGTRTGTVRIADSGRGSPQRG